MEILIFTFGAAFFKPGTGGNIHFTAYNGVDGILPLNMFALFIDRFLAGGKKFHCSEHVTVIRQGKMLHPHGLGLVGKGHYRNGSVLEGKIGMDMEVGKGGHG